MVSQDAQGNVIGPGDIRAQTRQTLTNIQTVLRSVGGTMADIAKVTVFVTEMSGLATIHEVRREFFTPPYPASTLVQVARLVKLEYMIEIEAVAVIAADRVRRLPA
jgi:enamine deaminase RidA (YjgF/YER057c/UK114 family)